MMMRDLGDNEENETRSADGLMLLHRQLVWLKPADVISPTEAPSYQFHSMCQDLKAFCRTFPTNRRPGPKRSSLLLGVNK